MKKENICKFIFATTQMELVTHYFVRETDAKRACAAHKREEHCAFLSVAEGGEIVINGERMPFPHGMLCFAFEGEESYVLSGSETDYMYIGFNGVRAEELFARFGISIARRVFPDNEGLIPFWQDSIARAEEANLDLISEGVLIYTFSRLHKCVKDGDDGMRRIMERLEEEFSDPSLTLSSVAREEGYHEKYLSHRFKEYTGVGFNRYLRNLRVKHAVFLLEHGVNAVKNVAVLCGFRDPLYFSKVFKEVMGVSPNKFAKRNEM